MAVELSHHHASEEAEYNRFLARQQQPAPHDEWPPSSLDVSPSAAAVLHAAEVRFKPPPPSEPHPDDVPRLPPNWTQHHDETSGHDYFYNDATGVTQWEPPVADAAASAPPPHLPASRQPQPRAQAHPQPVLHQPSLVPTAASRPAVAEPKPAAMSEAIEPLNKDYASMAREYAQFKAYRDLDGDQFCLLCHKAPSTYVLFPCGHKCICDGCKKSNGVVDSATWQKAMANPNGGGELWSFCPLCNEEIKRISKHTGTEYEDYWKWVNEVKPPLPRGFKSKFKSTHVEVRVVVPTGHDKGRGKSKGSIETPRLPTALYAISTDSHATSPRHGRPPPRRRPGARGGRGG